MSNQSRLVKKLKRPQYAEVSNELEKLQVNSTESATSLRKLIMDKSRIEEIKATITTHCSTIFEDVLPLKEKDPGSLGKLAPTKLIIKLADKIVKHPKGIAENVLVGIYKYVFPVDFIVLDMPEDTKIPLIIGRPFLSIARAKILVYKLKFALRIGNDKIVFKSNSPTSNTIKKIEDLGLTIEEGEVIDEPDMNLSKRFYNSIMKDRVGYEGKNVVGDIMNVHIFVGNFSIMIDFEVLKNMDAYRDKGMGDIIVGKHFCDAMCVEAR
ncbi:putative reverse transcriptase domain-containing protein [Tanacetum coccineum]